MPTNMISTVKNMIMIVDPLPNSNLDISKYLARHDVNILPNIYKEVSKTTSCDKAKCSALNELVMMKEFNRDREWFYGFELGKKEGSGVVINNGHITNMIHCKITDDKLYKRYMRDFKKLRHEWKYRAIVIKNKKSIKTEADKNIYKQLMPTLRQSQVDVTILNKSNFKNITMLRKEILKQIIAYEKGTPNVTQETF